MRKNKIITAGSLDDNVLIFKFGDSENINLAVETFDEIAKKTYGSKSHSIKSITSCTDFKDELTSTEITNIIIFAHGELQGISIGINANENFVSWDIFVPFIESLPSKLVIAFACYSGVKFNNSLSNYKGWGGKIEAEFAGWLACGY